MADRYANVIVLQTLTLAMDRNKKFDCASFCPTYRRPHVVERNDAPIRAAEGLPLGERNPCGRRSRRARDRRFGGVRFLVDFLRGQKTGLYLDQLENYSIVANMLVAGGCSIALPTKGDLRWLAPEHGALRGDGGGKRGRQREKASAERLPKRLSYFG